MKIKEECLGPPPRLTLNKPAPAMRRQAPLDQNRKGGRSDQNSNQESDESESEDDSEAQRRAARPGRKPATNRIDPAAWMEKQKAAARAKSAAMRGEMQKQENQIEKEKKQIESQMSAMLSGVRKKQGY